MMIDAKDDCQHQDKMLIKRGLPVLGNRAFIAYEMGSSFIR